jgi:hypothetical protein
MEKSLKAVFKEYTKTVPKIHDLDKLGTGSVELDINNN